MTIEHAQNPRNEQTIVQTSDQAKKYTNPKTNERIHTFSKHTNTYTHPIPSEGKSKEKSKGRSPPTRTDLSPPCAPQHPCPFMNFLNGNLTSKPLVAISVQSLICTFGFAWLGLLCFALAGTAFPSNHCLRGLEVGGAPGSGCPPVDPQVASDASNDI